MKWLRKLFSKTAEGVGEVEDVIHHPLYPIQHYTAVVEPGKLIRGAWPERKDLEKLVNDYQIMSVVNLCSERKQDKLVESFKLYSCNIGIEDNTVPSWKQVYDFLNTVATFAPVYVHCEEGKGRTGCMVAAYRVLRQDWTPKAALMEAKQMGLSLPSQEDFILGLKT